MYTRLRPALIITRRELRDQIRDWRIVVPIIALTSFFPWLLNFTARQLSDFMETYGAVVLGDRLVPFLLMMVGFFPITVSLVIALESFVGEKERRSIEPLLCSPLEDWQLYLGKLLAALVIPLIASYVGTIVYLVGVRAQIGWKPPAALLVQVLALTTVQALVMVSGAVVVSSQTTSVRAANLLASFIVIPMALLIEGESIIMFWGRLDTLWWAILGQVLIAGLLVRMGISYFNREELLGREIDSFNLRWIWKIFRTAFIGQAHSLTDWYTREVRSSLRRLRLPMAVMTCLLLSSVLIGAWHSSIITLPPDTFRKEEMVKRFLEGMQTIPFFTIDNIPMLWFHNLRAFFLATLIGIFTFGVLGVMILMLPLLIIGYFLGAAAGAGFSPWLFIAGFILPHGLLEIPAILLVGAAILQLGGTLTTPSGGKTIGEAWLFALADWARIMIALVMPMLLGAAIIEILITPRLALLVLGG